MSADPGDSGDFAEVEVLADMAFRLAVASLGRQPDADDALAKGKTLLRLAILCLLTKPVYTSLDRIDALIEGNSHACDVEVQWFIEHGAFAHPRSETYDEVLVRLERKRAMLEAGEFEECYCAMCAKGAFTEDMFDCGFCRGKLCSVACVIGHEARGHEAEVMEGMRAQ